MEESKIPAHFYWKAKIPKKLDIHIWIQITLSNQHTLPIEEIFKYLLGTCCNLSLGWVTRHIVINRPWCPMARTTSKWALTAQHDSFTLIYAVIPRHTEGQLPGLGGRTGVWMRWHLSSGGKGRREGHSMERKLLEPWPQGKRDLCFSTYASQRNSTKGRWVFLEWDTLGKGFLLSFVWD